MGPTFSMLAAGLLVAQTANPSLSNSGKPCNCQQNAPVGHIQPVAATTSSPGLIRGLFRSNSEPVAAEERPTFFGRIQGLFGKKKEGETFESAPVSQPQYADQTKPGPYRLMQRLPAGQPHSHDAGAPLVPVNPAPAKPLQPVTYQGVPPTQAAPAGHNVIPATNETAVRSAAVAPSRPNRISPDLVAKVGHETDYSWITGQLRIENGAYVIHYAPPEVVDTYHGSLTLTSERDLRGFQDGDFVSARGNLVGSANGRPLYRLTNIDRLPR